MINYFFRIQRSQHLSRLCAENGYRVFYLTTNINTVTKDLNVKEIYPNLFEISLWCETDRTLSVYTTNLTDVEISSIIDCIEYIKQIYGFNHFTSYVANPFWLQIINHISNTSFIFDCLDYTKGFNTHSNLILDLEEEIIKKEYVIYTSPILKELLDCQHNNYSFIRNACDFNYFHNIVNLKNDKNKKLTVGYYGAISDWFDVDLVRKVVEYYPDLDFHFIGNVYCNDLSHTDKINSLKIFPNVTFFGEIPYDKLDKYLSNFNVGIIPFIINDLIRCTNPVKLYEMFSFGLPVVLTEIPDVLTLNINNLCFISETLNNFIDNVKLALNESDVNKRIRIEYAKNNTWNNRFDIFNNVIRKVMPQISIILLCWNNWPITKKCIDSILQNSNYLYYELIIVNNNSTDETRKQLNIIYKNIPNIKIIHNDVNYGFSMGMNIGALNASYDYIILLNNDTIVGKNWLYPLVKPLILNNYGMGSPITNNCGNEVKQFIYFTDVDDLLCKSIILQKRNKFKICQIDRIPFFCAILRKKDFFAVGMLDINYKFGGWEDDDIIYKIKIYNEGKQNFYTFGSFVYHMESLTMKKITQKTNWTHDNPNQQYFEKKWNVNWISPNYKIHIINIKINSNKKWVLNLFTNASINNKHIFSICNNDNNYNDIIEINDEDDCKTYYETTDNKKITIVEKNINEFVIKNKTESILLNKNNPMIHDIYTFLNSILINIY